jgi:nucleoside-diphosphate kinase
MKYYLDDGTIELLHSKMKSQFLARIYYPEVQLSDLYLGNSITVFNRLLSVKAYANSATERYMSQREEHFFASVEGSAKNKMGDLMSLGTKYGLTFNRVKTSGSSFFEEGVNISAGDLVIEFVSVSKIDSGAFIEEARRLSSGINIDVRDAGLISKLFDACTGHNILPNCTLCLIKPHVLKARAAGSLLTAIAEAGFETPVMFSTHLNASMADYLLDVYKGIYPKFTAMMEHMTCSPLLAVMVTGGEDVVSSFRDLCGPLEPGLAQKLRPKSLRSQFGADVIKNACHCTDLDEDGEVECKYIFETIANV